MALKNSEYSELNSLSLLVTCSCFYLLFSPREHLFLINGSAMYLRAQVRAAIGKPLSHWFSTLIAIWIKFRLLSMMSQGYTQDLIFDLRHYFQSCFLLLLYFMYTGHMLVLQRSTPNCSHSKVIWTFLDVYLEHYSNKIFRWLIHSKHS